MSATALILLTMSFLYVGFKYLSTYFSLLIMVLGAMFFISIFDVGFLAGLFLFDLILILILIVLKIKYPHIQFF
jgi:hypothetical protein